MRHFPDQGAIKRAVLALLMIHSTSLAIAQCISPAEVCGKGNISVCVPNVSSSTCYPNNCMNVPFRCQQQRFQVYLEANDDNIVKCLDYNLLEVSVQLSVTAPTGRQPLSMVNVNDTKSCNDDGFNPFGPFINATKRTVSFSLSDLTGLPAIVLPPKQTFLFIVVVDVWPGETVNLKCTNALYGWQAIDGDQTCVLGFDAAGTEVTVPQPADDPSLIVGFGQTSSPSNAAYKDLPFDIFNSSGNQNVEQLEVSFKMVPSTKDFIPPVIVDAGSALNYTVSPPVAILNPVTGLQEWHYVCTLTGNIWNGQTTLFWVRAFRPTVFKKCGTMCPVISSVRVIRSPLGQSECKTPGIQSAFASCADFGPCLPDCSQNISITATATSLASTMPGSCGFRVRFSFDWPENVNTYELTKLKLVFEFAGGGSFTISPPSASGGAINCPANNNNPVLCSGCSSVSGNVITYCFNQGAGNESLILRKKDASGQVVYTDVIFTANIGATISEVRLLESEFHVKGAFSACVPGAFTQQGFPIGPPYVAGTIMTQDQKKVPNATITIVPNGNACAPQTTTTDFMGNYAICACGYGAYTVTPSRKYDLCGGIEEQDIFLITQHILNLMPFTSPYTMIAADINRSGTITMLDVIELRRCLLGHPPFNQNVIAWQFVPSSYNFPNPMNPFAPPFPTSSQVVVGNGVSATGVNFVGMKSGDVQGNYTPRQSEQPLVTETVSVKKDQVFSVPLRSGAKDPLALVHAVLRFNPEDVEYLGTSIGQVKGLTPDCFGLTDVSSGIIRMLWLAVHLTEQPLFPDQVLCHLRFKAKRPLSSENPLLQLVADNRLKPVAFTSEGEKHPLRLNIRKGVQERMAGSDFQKVAIYCIPNPAKGAVTLVSESMQNIPRAGLMVTDAFGRTAHYNEYEIAEGTGAIYLKGSDAWNPGLYAWVLFSNGMRLSEGRFVKTE